MKPLFDSVLSTLPLNKIVHEDQNYDLHSSPRWIAVAFN